MKMHLEVVTPEGSKVSTQVADLIAPGAVGELGILPSHIPVLTVLDIGKLSYQSIDSSEEQHLAVAGGFLEVDNDRLIVITESAEFAAEIDVERAEQARQSSEEELKTLESGSTQFDRRARSLKRAEVRLAVAKHAG
ncbi:MAG TPA: F0F1 ATP synthase subunit epsilon [Myxococcales bacterium]|nr:F0F1 ATP synthase subunit epsilon [Myxococcales bacterium]HIN86423.1 F0F1 ATP synthase subunit epsilon [Myxococcales bacterium]